MRMVEETENVVGKVTHTHQTIMHTNKEIVVITKVAFQKLVAGRPGDSDG